MKKFIFLLLLISSVLIAKAQIPDTLTNKLKKIHSNEFEIAPRADNKLIYLYLDDKIPVPTDIEVNTHNYAVIAMYVDSNGSPGNLRLLKSYSATVDPLILSAINSLPQLKPAYNNGNNVGVELVMTIRFIKLPTVNARVQADCELQRPDNPMDPTANYNSIFTAIEKEPVFPGPPNAFGDFLRDNIVYPAQAKASHIKGLVVLSFVINKDGSLSSFRVLRSPDDELSKEALRVMHKCPNFIPGIQNGKPLSCQYAIPINFNL